MGSRGAAEAHRHGTAPRKTRARRARGFLGAILAIWLVPICAGASQVDQSLSYEPYHYEQYASEPESTEQETYEQEPEEASDQQETDESGEATIPTSWERDPAVDATLDDLLSSGRFRFCQEEGYRLWPHEKLTYCDQASEFAARCPELPRACERPAQGAEKVEWQPNVSWLGTLGTMARVLFWLVLAVGVFLLVRAIARSLMNEVRRKRRNQDAPVVLAPATNSEPELPRETDVERLLNRARKEAEQGDFAAALTSAHAAALQALQQRNLLKLHRSRTNGEYVRQLGAHPTERQHMRHIVREVEAVQFGHGDADRDRFERVMLQVSALVQRTTVWLFALLLPVVLTACGESSPSELPHSPTGPDGHALLESLLQRHSQSVQRRVRRISGSLDDVDTFVALSPDLSGEEWGLIMDWVFEGGTLFAAGIPEPLAKRLPARPTSMPCQSPLSAEGLSVTQVASNTFEEFVDAVPLITCGEAPFLVGMDYGDGVIYAIASTVWLRNANLLAADNAQVVVRLAASPEGRVELLGPWTGSGTQHPLASIQNAGLTPFLLQLLLLALAFALARGIRFQSPLEPLRARRRAFVEHAEALANQYERSGASGYALEQYGRWALERIRERVPLRERDLHALAHAVARRTGGEPMAILKVLVEAQSAGQIQGAPEEHLRTMEALSRILRDVGGP